MDEIVARATPPRISVLMFNRDVYGLKLLNLLRWSGVPVEQVIACTDAAGSRRRWLRRLARRVGWPGALAYTAWRMRTNWRRRSTSWRGRRLERDYRRLAGRVDYVERPGSTDVVSALRVARAELCVLADCGVVPPVVLAVPSFGTINAHPGVLPDYRGLDTPLWAVHEGRFDKVGCSLHVVDAGIDTGPILAVRPYRWRGDESIDRLTGRLEEECLSLLAEACAADWPALLERAMPQGPGRYYSFMPIENWLRVRWILRRAAPALGGQSPR